MDGQELDAVWLATMARSMAYQLQAFRPGSRHAAKVLRYLKERGFGAPLKDAVPDSIAQPLDAALIQVPVSAFDRTSRPTADAGPWMASTWPPREGRPGIEVVLQSYDFEHDSALVVTGNFGSAADRVSYAARVALSMNGAAELGPDEPQAWAIRSRGTTRQFASLELAALVAESLTNDGHHVEVFPVKN